MKDQVDAKKKSYDPESGHGPPNENYKAGEDSKDAR
jgi:hypothetical protein